MPRLLLCLLPTFAFLSNAFATDLTVVVDFEGPHSDHSVREMKREVEDIMKQSGLHLDWRAGHEALHDTPANLVVVRFKGHCLLEPVPMLYDERGPFAFAYSSDGEMLPFAEVDCNHVAASVHSAMSGDDYARPDYLMGRALGRVVAHELVHVITKSASHGRNGVATPSLSGKELIGAPLRLSRSDVERLRTATGQSLHDLTSRE
jgi:hypothetical protein